MFTRTEAIALACASFIVAGCSRGQTQPPPPKAPAVLFGYPVVKKVTDYEDLTGRTDAIPTVEVRARVTGYLIKANFQDGAIVKEGETLFEVDPRAYEAELAKADANFDQSKARVKRLEKDHDRAQILMGRNAISREDFDKISGDLEEARATVNSAAAARRVASINVEFTKVRAPIGGLTSRRLIDPGNLVKADETPLTTIVNLEPMYAYFDVDERTVLRLQKLIREGKINSARDKDVPVSLGLSDEDGFPHKGKINFVDNKLDAGTGTLRLRGVFPNSKNILSPGLFVRIRVQVGVPYRALLIPERALGTNQGQKFLYVINDKNEVVDRSVKVGAVHDGLRVVEKGLAEGEKVIVSGLQRSRPGIVVDPRLAEDAPAGK